MTNYVMIENQGEIEIEALSLLGASTKRGDDGKIGMFGSGNKYAIALLLRLNIPFTIYSGEQEIQVRTRSVSLRGQEFDNIYFQIGDRIIDTSLTVQAGPDWRLWYAIRELYCNAIDEGNYQMVNSTMHKSPRQGYTRFYIQHTDTLQDVLDQWNCYFSEDRIDCIYADRNIKAFKSERHHFIIYRKGVNVYESSSTCIFHYDTLDAAINESRTLVDFYATLNHIGMLMTESASAEILTLWLTGMDRMLRGERQPVEYNMDLTAEHIKLNIEEWEKALQPFIFVNHSLAGKYKDAYAKPNSLVLPHSWLRDIGKVFPELTIYGIHTDSVVPLYQEVEMTEEMQRAIFNAKKVLKPITQIRNNIPENIVIAKFLHSSMEGKVHHITGGMLVISEHIFEDPSDSYLIVRSLVYGSMAQQGLETCTEAFEDRVCDEFCNYLRYASSDIGQ